MPYMNTDVPELGGYDTGTVLENLGLIFSRQEPWLEATVAQLSELADAILSDAAFDTDTLYSILLIFQALELVQYWFHTHLKSKYPSVIMLLAYIPTSAYKIYLLFAGIGPLNENLVMSAHLSR